MTPPDSAVSSEAPLDEALLGQFLGQLTSIYTGSMLSYMIDIGYRTGLFAAAAPEPATSAQLANRAGLNERYVREWLGAMVTGAIFGYSPLDQTYSLAPERAACLTTGPTNLAPMVCGTRWKVCIIRITAFHRS